MKEQAVLEKWEKEIEKSFCKLLPQVREVHERIKRDLTMSIWLGGPGRKNEKRYVRERIRKLLEKQNFNVYFSEDYSGAADIVSKEAQEVDTLQLAMIIAISAGASAEAIEFANDNCLDHKLTVFIPEEYKEGYVYRSLSEKHHLIANPTCFSLEKLLKRDDPDLALKMIHSAIDCRFNYYRQVRQKKLQSLPEDMT
jgi:hypothetical protein